MTQTPTAINNVVKLSEAEAAAMLHDSYLVQIREQSCANCQSGERWSEIFEVWAHPYKTHRTRAHVLRPTLSLRAGLAVSYLKLPTVMVPVCSDCIETFNPQTGVAPIPALSHAEWVNTLARKYAPEAPAKAARPEPTLDQL